MPDWKSKESSDHLLAAIIASLPDNVKLNYNRIASLYGQNATYDAIEGRCRGLKKHAQKMRDDLANGVLQPAPGRGSGNVSSSTSSTPRKPKTPRKNNDAGISPNGVMNGRVTKSANSSPTKKRTAAQIKRELLEASASSSAVSSTDYLSSAEHSATEIVDDSFACGMDDVAASFNDINQFSFDDLNGHLGAPGNDPTMADAFWDLDQEHVV